MTRAPGTSRGQCRQQRQFEEVMPMATSVKSKPKSDKVLVVAVRTVPPAGIERTTDFHKVDAPFSVVEIDGIAVYQVHRKGQIVASYPAPTVISCRMSNRKFRTHKVVFVRRIERVGGSVKK
jgi:hypothetical protein